MIPIGVTSVRKHASGISGSLVTISIIHFLLLNLNSKQQTGV